MFNLNAPVVNYYGVTFAYRECSLQGEERRQWRDKRREAQRMLKAEGFRRGGALDTRSRAEAERYAEEWNAKHTFDPILGPLEVYEYSYL